MYKSLSKFLFLLLILAAVSTTGFAQEVFLEYYGEMGCSHCDLFQEKILPNAEEQTGIEAEASYYDILSESGFERCKKRLREKGYRFSVFPVLIIGNNAYQGNNAVENGLIEELAYYSRHGEYLPHIETDSPVKTINDMNFSFLPVFLAGLVDGVNPCAFATMLFFISWIALKGGSKRRMILASSGFIIGIFLAYLSIGFGLFSFFRSAGSMLIIRNIMRYLFSSLALLFALLSIRDAVAVKRTGKPGAILLQLPSGMKKRAHRVIRNSRRTGNRYSILLFPGLVFTGIVVAFLELACTGQIYFPTIAYMVQSGGGESPVSRLLLYNTAFILPLLVLFAATQAGLSQQKIAGWFERNLAAGKIAAALLFALLAVIIWISG